MTVMEWDPDLNDAILDRVSWSRGLAEIEFWLEILSVHDDLWFEENPR